MRGMPLDKKLNFVSYPAVRCFDAALTGGEMVKKDKTKINVFFFFFGAVRGRSGCTARQIGVGVSNRLKVHNWAGNIKYKV